MSIAYKHLNLPLNLKLSNSYRASVAIHSCKSVIRVVFKDRDFAFEVGMDPRFILAEVEDRQISRINLLAINRLEALEKDKYQKHQSPIQVVEQQKNVKENIPLTRNPVRKEKSNKRKLDDKLPLDTVSQKYVGVISDFGMAQFDDSHGNNKRKFNCYFIEIEESNGEVHSIRGTNLEDAIEDSGSEIGDLIELTEHKPSKRSNAKRKQAKSFDIRILERN